MTTIGLADLDPTGHTSFSFYDLLPGNQVTVEGAPDAADALALATRLLRTDLLEAGDQEIDSFAALLVTHGHLLPPSGEFKQLADATARGFAALIGNEARRPRRMRLTRLSLMLRVVLDRTESTAGVLSDTTLPCKSPWDFIAMDGSSQDGWVASCDENNFRRLEAGACVWSRRLGLPTQLDRLGDGLWVGSHYSDGGFIVTQAESADPQVLEIAHSCPLVLAFEFGGTRYALDSRGALGKLAGDQVGPALLRLPGTIHRARIIGDSLYAFDWGQAGVGFRIDLRTLQAVTIRTGDIIVCNDICAQGDWLYGICKLQGRVFKMTRDWTPVSTRLGAGTGPGQLLDPIMIRCEADVLGVVNWFSSRIVRLPAF
ncbi:hypothetical protein [Caenimonas sp. SL110]|uniref:hypothetical protein n=1 Tax=Caenimonas sp. SL110 TaxID=1450524 RepID=UPI0006530F58|nr:hypothetical protein [Caenimonas sp. SL110]